MAVKSSLTREHATTLFDQIGSSGVRQFADVGGTSFDASCVAWRLWACQIVLIDIDSTGNFPHRPSAWVEPYRRSLIAQGVDAKNILYVGEIGQLQPYDLIFALNGFGDRSKIRHISPILNKAVHGGSRLVLDIRKGSGAFPFLRDFGETRILTKLSEDYLQRVLFLTGGAASKSNPGMSGLGATWASIAATLAGSDGFFRADPSGHSFLFVPRDPKVLVVTFDNLDIAMNNRAERRPWGFEFIEKQNWSMLGVMAGGWTWYRDDSVFAEFDRLRDEGFFGRFERVVFYGASMGGYAAAAFSAAAPGADVVAISPQSTLDRRIVPFETRYRTAWGRDFDGSYGDASVVSRTARRVTIFYDPYERLDTGHVDRFSGDNVIKLRCPMMGHRLGSSLQQMGILSTTVVEALSGTLNPSAFYSRLRVRRSFPRYQFELFQRALERGRTALALRVARWVLARGDHPGIRRAAARLDSGDYQSFRDPR